MAGRLLAISDLHIGYPENRAHVDALLPGDPDDWLIVAGDVGEMFADIGLVLGTLASRFARVIWVPGNHELWTHPADPVQVRGIARYEALVKVCRRFGVLTPEDEFPVWDGPGGPVTVAPLFTLYDYTFSVDGAAGKPGRRPAGRSQVDGSPAPADADPADADPADADPADADQAKADKSRRIEVVSAARAAGVTVRDEGRLYPDPYPSVAAWCRSRVTESASRLSSVTGPTVLVSHWPLLPAPLTALRHPEFAPWCGTALTAGWHIRHHALAAVYGHLHIPRTTHHDGVRFEEVSVGYPREWRRRHGAPPQPRVVLGGTLR